MKIRLGYDIAFDVAVPTPILMLLKLHPSEQHKLLGPETLIVEPDLALSEYFDDFGNAVLRGIVPPGSLTLKNNAIVQVSDDPDPIVFGAEQHPVSELPHEVLPFLLSSRYCEVDRLSDIAWNLFGNTPLGWGRVAAVCTWVHNHLEFGYPHARSTRSAYDAYCEGKGVCRDFAHLALTFCRCMNIPARYVTGYLGDIGVPISPDPMDFSGWFEAYLGGRWHTFDARHNQRRLGRVVMARGRDAVDVALTTSFGVTTLTKWVVWTDKIEG